MKPYFYGGAGKMDVSYGERKLFQFIDGDGFPVARTTITLSSVTEEGDSITETQQTDAEGRAGFDVLSTRHFKYGNSLENGGEAGEPGWSEYQRYVFSAKGYTSYTLP
jgi:hypothetical protein